MSKPEFERIDITPQIESPTLGDLRALAIEIERYVEGKGDRLSDVFTNRVFYTLCILHSIMDSAKDARLFSREYI